MPINPVPENSGVIVDPQGVLTAQPAWLEFFRSVFFAVFGWKRSFTATVTFDFPNIVAQSQSTTTVACVGARAGDAVIVRPATAVNGIIVDGTVTANDVVTLRAVNYSAGAIDPASQAYRVVVFQQ